MPLGRGIKPTRFCNRSHFHCQPPNQNPSTMRFTVITSLAVVLFGCFAASAPMPKGRYDLICRRLGLFTVLTCCLYRSRCCDSGKGTVRGESRGKVSRTLHGGNVRVLDAVVLPLTHVQSGLRACVPITDVYTPTKQCDREYLSALVADTAEDALRCQQQSGRMELLSHSHPIRSLKLHLLLQLCFRLTASRPQRPGGRRCWRGNLSGARLLSAPAFRVPFGLLLRLLLLAIIGCRVLVCRCRRRCCRSSCPPALPR